MRQLPRRNPMKKLIITSLAAAALCTAAGAAFADADCQAGSAWGYKEGCGGPSYGPAYGDANSGWPPAVQPQPYAYSAPQPYYDSRVYPPVVSVGPQYPYATRRLHPSRRDRDGDGVPNWRDRYPDDPTRW
jgi:hypothetical protein